MAGVPTFDSCYLDAYGYPLVGTVWRWHRADVADANHCCPHVLLVSRVGLAAVFLRRTHTCEYNNGDVENYIRLDKFLRQYVPIKKRLSAEVSSEESDPDSPPPATKKHKKNRPETVKADIEASSLFGSTPANLPDDFFAVHNACFLDLPDEAFVSILSARETVSFSSDRLKLPILGTADLVALSAVCKQTANACRRVLWLSKLGKSRRANEIKDEPLDYDMPCWGMFYPQAVKDVCLEGRFERIKWLIDRGSFSCGIFWEDFIPVLLKRSPTFPKITEILEVVLTVFPEPKDKLGVLVPHLEAAIVNGDYTTFRYLESLCGNAVLPYPEEWYWWFAMGEISQVSRDDGEGSRLLSHLLRHSSADVGFLTRLWTSYRLRCGTAATLIKEEMKYRGIPVPPHSWDF